MKITSYGYFEFMGQKIERKFDDSLSGLCREKLYIETRLKELKELLKEKLKLLKEKQRLVKRLKKIRPVIKKQELKEKEEGIRYRNPGW